MATYVQDHLIVQPFRPAGVAAHIWRHSPGLTLYCILVVTQLGHVGEHAAQMIQIHGLHLPGREAHGIVGALDIEWVHFVWNTWVLVAVVLLAARFRRNGWLWLALLAAGWHEIEHVYLLAIYLTTGTAGAPGLLAAGGAIAGGLPLRRPDLHFLYNLVETLPLVLGFARQSTAAMQGLCRAASGHSPSTNRHHKED